MKNIPSTDRIADAQTRAILSAMKEAIEILQGQRGTLSDRALLVSDLSKIGIIGVINDKILYNPNAQGQPSFASATLQRTVSIGGISGTLEAIDPVTKTTMTYTISGGTITGVSA